MQSLGRLLVLIGLGLVAAGALLWWAGRTGLAWPRLPGDIVIQRPNFRLYLPLGTSLLLSLLLSGLLYLISRLR
ncbi:MAG: hypothetical protein KatS3mg026_0893 [Bacteroidia bacterium]|nr:MAG: hypothetical protein KatS3mg026_0893 [Bacteroidia bacterium]